MELGSNTMQVFTSLILILGAALVALICDYLKGSNEKLRELTLELTVRREEEYRRVPRMDPAFSSSQDSVMDHGAQLAVTPPQAREAEGHLHDGENEETGPAALLAEQALAEQLLAEPSLAEQSPMEQMFGPHTSVPGEMESQSPAPKPQLVVASSSTGAHPQRIPEQVLMQAMAASSAASSAAIVPRKTTRKDWNSLLTSTRRAPQAASAAPESNLLAAVVEATTSDLAAPLTAVLPAGLHEENILNDLLRNRQPVSGLVIAVGTNTPGKEQDAFAERVSAAIRSLLGPTDFAVRSAPDEFWLIFPNERGASAQRRLRQTAQQLWDFQLHSLGSGSVLFSWGGLEVRGEPLDEAIASARERMQETRRGRKNLLPELAPLGEPLSQAV